MLENYELTRFGIIKQIKRENFNYDLSYSEKYNVYNDKNKQLANLRMGVLVGAINKIPTSIMDVGYGNGIFLECAQEIIPKCYGSDLHNRFPLPNKCEFVENIFEKEVEVITFFDSLEHFDDIFIIDKLKCKYIMITLPWCHYFTDEWFNNWVHRKPNEHLWHFNDIALVNFIESFGFKCIHKSNFEDAIRKRETFNNSENILACIFEKI